MHVIKKIIMNDREKHELFQSIMEKDKLHWKKFNNPNEIFKWLLNFDASNDAEIKYALMLADNILYYNDDEIKTLWRIILMNRVKSHLIEALFSKTPLPNDIDKWFNDYISKKTIFVGFGPPEKSGPSLCYAFQKSQAISCKIHNMSEILSGDEATFKHLEKIDSIFFLDDFLGSGNQAQSFWGKKYERLGGQPGISIEELSVRLPHLNLFYLCLVGFHNGKKELEENTKLKVIIGEQLTDKFKCFSSDSYAFRNSAERKEAEEIMTRKGRMLYKYPLGYGDMQLLVSFFHNTPNNTLPVIWKKTADGTWHPLFERID